MALIGDKERHLLLGIAVGAGAAWLARDLLTPLTRLARPVTKAGIRAGLDVAERGRETLARLGEHLDDLAAEVKAEREVDELTRAAGHTPPPPDAPRTEVNHDDTGH